MNNNSYTNVENVATINKSRRDAAAFIVKLHANPTAVIRTYPLLGKLRGYDLWSGLLLAHGTTPDYKDGGEFYPQNGRVPIKTRIGFVLMPMDMRAALELFPENFLGFVNNGKGDPWVLNYARDNAVWAAQHQGSDILGKVLKAVAVAVALYFTAGAVAGAGAAGAGAAGAGAAGAAGFSLSGTIAAGTSGLGASSGVASAVGTIGSGMLTSAGAQLITTGKVNTKQAITSGVIGYGIGFAGDYIGGQAGNVAGNIGLSPNVAAKVASASNAITIAAGTEYIQSGRVTGKSVVMAGLSAALNSGESTTVAGVKISDIVSTGQSIAKLIAARDELAAQRRQGAEYAAQMVELASLDAEIKRALAEQAQAEQAQTKQAKLAPVKAKTDIMPLMVAALFAAKLLIFS